MVLEGAVAQLCLAGAASPHRGPTVSCRVPQQAAARRAAGTTLGGALKARGMRRSARVLQARQGAGRASLATSTLQASEQRNSARNCSRRRAIWLRRRRRRCRCRRRSARRPGRRCRSPTRPSTARRARPARRAPRHRHRQGPAKRRPCVPVLRARHEAQKGAAEGLRGLSPGAGLLKYVVPADNVTRHMPSKTLVAIGFMGYCISMRHHGLL